MKKLIIFAVALLLMSGTASSADVGFGLFNSTTDHTDANVSVEGLAFQNFYHVYVWGHVRTAETGFVSWEFKLVKSNGDFKMNVTFTDPATMVIGSGPFDPAGWTVAGVDCYGEGWNMVADIEMMYMGAPGTIEMMDDPDTGASSYADCATVEHPADLLTTFGINMGGVGTKESSWGAVKSMYK